MSNPQKAKISSKKSTKSIEKALKEIGEEISSEREKVLAEFYKAYLADTKVAMSDVELIHELNAEGMRVRHTFYFQIKEKATKSHLIIK